MLDKLVFLNPILGFCSFGIGIIFLYFFYKTKNNASKFKFISDLEEVFGNSKKYFYINIFFIFFIIIFFSLLIANPNLKLSKTKTKKDGIDIAIILDLSYSMIATDIEPNRLNVAKQVISNFTSKLKTDRVGLVLFSGKPFTSVPLTFDYNFITNYVKNISIKSINQNHTHLQGTAIGDALLYGANMLKDDMEREKVVVLFTDGEANKGIDPIKAVKYLEEKNIKVHTVGIGGSEDTYVTIENIYGTQKIGIGGVDETNLKAIANLTNGLYYRADTKETFLKIFEKLNLIPKKEIEIEEYVFFTPYYEIFVYILFFLILSFSLFNFYNFLRK